MSKREAQTASIEMRDVMGMKRMTCTLYSTDDAPTSHGILIYEGDAAELLECMRQFWEKIEVDERERDA